MLAPCVALLERRVSARAALGAHAALQAPRSARAVVAVVDAPATTPTAAPARRDAPPRARRRRAAVAVRGERLTRAARARGRARRGLHARADALFARRPSRVVAVALLIMRWRAASFLVRLVVGPAAATTTPTTSAAAAAPAGSPRPPRAQRGGRGRAAALRRSGRGERRARARARGRARRLGLAGGARARPRRARPTAARARARAAARSVVVAELAALARGAVLAADDPDAEPMGSAILAWWAACSAVALGAAIALTAPSAFVRPTVPRALGGPPGGAPTRATPKGPGVQVPLE